MRKLYIVGLIAVAALVIGIAIADEIKFSTYYPAPYGKYREFDTTGKTCIATDEWGIEGTNARVGIGTTSPTAKLEIHNAAATEISALRLVEDAPASAGDVLKLEFFADSVDDAAIREIARIQAHNIQTGSHDGDLSFWTQKSTVIRERMRIDEDGNVGIGTTNPGHILHLADDGNAELLIEGADDNPSNWNGIRMRRARGSLSSKSTLQDNDTISALASQAWDGSTWQNVTTIHTVVDGTPFGSAIPGKIIFKLRGSDGVVRNRFTIKSNGNVGIGTTDPGYKLTVNGNASITGDLRNQYAHDNTIAQPANVFIDWDGAIRKAAGSSLRYKENIEDSNLGLDLVMKLRPVTFDYKKEVANASRQVGFIAEEVEQVTPMLVGYDKKGRIETVRYNIITSLLTKAIQEQQKKIDNLEGKITELKAHLR